MKKMKMCSGYDTDQLQKQMKMKLEEEGHRAEAQSRGEGVSVEASRQAALVFTLKSSAHAHLPICPSGPSAPLCVLACSMPHQPWALITFRRPLSACINPSHRSIDKATVSRSEAII